MSANKRTNEMEPLTQKRSSGSHLIFAIAIGAGIDAAMNNLAQGVAIAKMIDLRIERKKKSEMRNL